MFMTCICSANLFFKLCLHWYSPHCLRLWNFSFFIKAKDLYFSKGAIIFLSAFWNTSFPFNVQSFLNQRIILVEIAAKPLNCNSPLSLSVQKCLWRSCASYIRHSFKYNSFILLESTYHIHLLSFFNIIFYEVYFITHYASIPHNTETISQQQQAHRSMHSYQFPLCSEWMDHWETIS